MNPSNPVKVNKVWEGRKNTMKEFLQTLAEKSPVTTVHAVVDQGEELRTVLEFATATLVRAKNGAIVQQEPVVVGIRYHHRFLAQAPHPFEVVTILEPILPFHPNVSPGGALCLGHPQAGIPLAEIIHMTWAAITFNLHVMDTVEWHGFQPEAARFVRANPKMFPLTVRGLFEKPA